MCYLVPTSKLNLGPRPIFLSVEMTSKRDAKGKTYIDGTREDIVTHKGAFFKPWFSDVVVITPQCHLAKIGIINQL